MFRDEFYQHITEGRCPFGPTVGGAIPVETAPVSA
jgi:hypothetical protein